MSFFSCRVQGFCVCLSALYDVYNRCRQWMWILAVFVCSYLFHCFCCAILMWCFKNKDTTVSCRAIRITFSKQKNLLLPNPHLSPPLKKKKKKRKNRLGIVWSFCLEQNFIMNYYKREFICLFCVFYYDFDRFFLITCYWWSCVIIWLNFVLFSFSMCDVNRFCIEFSYLNIIELNFCRVCWHRFVPCIIKRLIIIQMLALNWVSDYSRWRAKAQNKHVLMIPFLKPSVQSEQ